MLEKMLGIVDSVSEWSGKVFSILFLPLVFLVANEVVARYIFNSPTLWGWDILTQLTGAIAVMGGGYAFLHQGHVVVETLVTHFSPRVRSRVDLVTSVFFFAGIGVLFWIAVGEARESVITNEHVSSLFRPPIYPLRIVVAIGFFVLLIQGIGKFIRDFKVATQSAEDPA